MIAGPVHIDLGDLAQVLLAVAAIIAAMKGRSNLKKKNAKLKAQREEDSDE
jgi:hypothetical protein